MRSADLFPSFRLQNERGKTFVVVSGHITFETVFSFLSDFHHEDREEVDVEESNTNINNP